MRSPTCTRLFTALLGCVLAFSAGAQAPVPQALGEGAWLLPGRFERGSQPDGNSLLLEGPAGLVVIDTGRHASHAQAILAWAAERRQPLVAVINTHWHLDHLAGNGPLRAAHPALRAHAAPAVRDAIRQRMPRSQAEIQAMLQDPALEPGLRQMLEVDLAIYARRSALEPDALIEAPPHDWLLAGRDIRVGVERGVSGGDTWVLDRRSGLLAVGDFITLPVPFLDTACPAQWREAFARLDALPFERVVPGHGPLMSRADFLRYRGAFERLLVCAASSEPAATCSAAWVSALGPLLPAAEGRRSHAMLEYYLAERLRAQPPKQDC